MNDTDAMKRREDIFELYRKMSAELDDEYVELSKLQDAINAKSQDISNKNNMLNEINRVISVMISKDCCPVEARLKYPELINPPEEEKYDRYQSAEASATSYPATNRIYSSATKRSIKVI